MRIVFRYIFSTDYREKFFNLNDWF